MLAGDLAHPRAARIIRDMSDEELVALVDRAESVSYTHLDVYKRQI